MTQASTILGLLAQTSIHAGTGQNTGIIDLPIQREGHNGWPCVFGSAMKGALRTRAETQYGKENASVIYVFGPSPSPSPNTNNASEHAGAIMVSDARLLLLPIRSLTSQFKWVTCPDALKRYQRDAERFGLTVGLLSSVNVEVEGDEALVATKEADGALFLEEYRFNAKSQDLSVAIKSIAQLMQRDDAEEVLQNQLVIVSNDMFAHLCQHATPVNAHIAIESETKTVKDGALWYEETLPPETLLYVGLSANPVRKPKGDKIKVPLPQDESGKWVLESITNLFRDRPWLQIGGNETVGMGWCAVKVLQGGQ
ncbi:type III-B CRISPR module RAMP protein Cmr4 [Thiofilum flexile]|uniref:type III-B CRISPR module RAMP protein Cmr4 n=1 Tax=Thiofilum flexile TaxID=125627 RepID=UPI000366C3F8|nr:type III-B CRISPR module RAMP protein Cmr4 [Thiofilum flexile]